MKWSKNLISLAVAVIFGLSLILAPVVSQVSPVQAAITWTYPNAVTLEGATYVEDAWVIKDGNTYKMWYTCLKTDLTQADLDTMDAASFGINDLVDMAHNRGSGIGSYAIARRVAH